MGTDKLSDFSSIVGTICEDDSRYAVGAYFFVRKALDYTVAQHKKTGATTQHISGTELLEGIRAYALDQFGVLSMTVLREWGLSECRDFGEIVFHLVDYGVLGKSETDSREDFNQGYSFEEAFVDPFRPKSLKVNQARKRSVRRKKDSEASGSGQAE